MVLSKWLFVKKVGTMFVYLLGMILFLIDQIVKYLIVHTPILQAYDVIPGFFRLYYVRNTGMAWSLLSGNPWLLSVVGVCAIIVLIYIVQTKQLTKLEKLSAACIFGGALGNLIDRILTGSVVDYLSFNLFGYLFPVFNLADVFLCIGVGLIILETLLKEGVLWKKKSSS